MVVELGGEGEGGGGDGGTCTLGPCGKAYALSVRKRLARVLSPCGVGNTGPGEFEWGRRGVERFERGMLAEHLSTRLPLTCTYKSAANIYSARGLFRIWFITIFTFARKQRTAGEKVNLREGKDG